MLRTHFSALLGCVTKRYQRVARGGLTSRTLRDEKDPVGVLGMAGSVILTPHSPPPTTAPSFDGAGGRFGGGGAGGKY
jgi:hypothetical protein